MLVCKAEEMFNVAYFKPLPYMYVLFLFTCLRNNKCEEPVRFFEVIERLRRCFVASCEIRIIPNQLTAMLLGDKYNNLVGELRQVSTMVSTDRNELEL